MVLCPPCHAQTDAPYARGRRVITPLGGPGAVVGERRGEGRPDLDVVGVKPAGCEVPCDVSGVGYILIPGGFAMAKTKVAVTLDSQTLRRVDRLVRDARYPNRSQAIEAAVAAQLERLEHRRLADECAKLDPAAERAMAEEGLGLDAAGWPEY